MFKLNKRISVDLGIVNLLVWLAPPPFLSELRLEPDFQTRQVRGLHQTKLEFVLGLEMKCLN